MNSSVVVTVSLSGNPNKPIISDDLLAIMERVYFAIMFPLILMGIITNIINVRVFAKQGVRNDNTNIGFVSLSLCDLLCCVGTLPYILCNLLAFAKKVPQYITCIAITSPIVHVYFIMQKCGMWVTVYISLLRCLCVVTPLKVKTLFTPKTTVIIIVSIIVFMSSENIIYSAFTRVVWIFHSRYNTSIAIYTDTPFAQDYLYYLNIIDGFGFTFVAIVIVTITTSIMVRKLFEVKKWRQANAKASSGVQDSNSSEKKSLSSKDIELIKSVTAITCIFIFCVLLSYIPAIAINAVTGVLLSGINRNLLIVVHEVRVLFNIINSSVNFFLYIRISSRYKSAFALLFPSCFPQSAE